MRPFTFFLTIFAIASITLAIPNSFPRDLIDLCDWDSCACGYSCCDNECSRCQSS